DFRESPARGKALTSGLVFSRTKHGADKIVKHLIGAGLSAQAIHGNRSQGQRERALKAFKSGDTRILVATDIAARGIDIQGVSHVINFDLPNAPETYVHRIGRTGRAGAAGTAISFCSPEERAELRAIERLTGQRFADSKGEDAPSRAGRKGPRRPRPKGNGSRRSQANASIHRKADKTIDKMSFVRPQR
ncbi:MAG: C-terminal helicase domain-containing protein, partial [Pseudomonadota bacterium]